MSVRDNQGNEAGSVRYHAFGADRSSSGTLSTDKKFTGQTLDASTGLYWYASRAYDSSLGRFTQPDTIVPDPANPQRLNRFSYALNNPVKYSDLTGHYAVFVGGVGTDNDPDKNQEAWGSMIRNTGLKEGEYEFFDWSAGGRYSGTPSDYRLLDDAAKDLAGTVAGRKDVTLVGHSKGGALVLEYLAQVAEGRLSANEGLVGAYSIDAPLDNLATAQRRQWTLAPLPRLVDRYAHLPGRLAERGLSVDVATFDNPADFPFATHAPLPGVPRYEWAVGPRGGESLLPPQYQFAAHGLLLKDPRVATYLLGAYRQGGW